MPEKKKRNIDPTRVRPPTRRVDLQAVIPDYYDRGGFVAMEVCEAVAANWNIGCVITYVCRAGHKPGELASVALTKARHALWRELRLHRPDTSDEGWEGPCCFLPDDYADQVCMAWDLGSHEGHVLQHLFRFDLKRADEALRMALTKAIQEEGRTG
jgi:hypothetical protein